MNEKEEPHLLNEDVCQQMANVIHQITNKKHKLMKEDSVTELLNLCGNSDQSVQRIYQLLLDNLNKKHSEIRFNTFYIINIFFKNYHTFRLLTVKDLKAILELTAEINYDLKLPPPKAAAEDLKTLTLRSIKEWVQMFGTNYKKLNLCYDFLRHKKRVDFEKFEIEDQASKKRKEAEQKRKQIITEERLQLLKNSMNEVISDINTVKESLMTCLKLLIPTPEQFFIPENCENEKDLDKSSNILSSRHSSVNELVTQELDDNKAKFRESGMLEGNFAIDINLPEIKNSIRIKENEENSVIIENAKGYYKLLNNKYINTVKNWIKNLTTLSDDSTELKKVIDLKSEIEVVIRKYEILIFEKEFPIEKDDSDSDSEMIDVAPQMRSVDEEIIANLQDMPSTSGINSSSKSAVDLSANEEGREHFIEKTERKKKLLEIAPKLPFDVDLYHWEEEKLSTPMLLPVTAEGRQFWSASTMEDTDGIPDPEGTAGLRTRIIEFTGKFERVKWHCRFPLPNGKLCPRQDRYKCPFHGIIVPRNEIGQCVNQEEEKKQREKMRNSGFNDAQDPKLLVEIQKETGIDLTIRKKKRKKACDNALTDIRKEQNTVYKRLEKKVFNKSVMKKVAQTLDNLDRKRHRDKYGDQFQYVHGTT